MELDDYIKQIQPRQKKSRLIPFVEQIFALKTAGYTDMQIRDWLDTNGLQVSREMVRQFIAKNGPIRKLNKNQKNLPAIANLEQNINEDKNEHENETNAEKIRRVVAKQKDDALKKQFKHDKTGCSN
jgi:aspartyl aminopeptidase